MQQPQPEDVTTYNGHTIMLVQFSSNEETRTFTDCKNPGDCMETLVRIFENFLYNRDANNLEYTLEDLLKFVD